MAPIDTKYYDLVGRLQIQFTLSGLLSPCSWECPQMQTIRH